MRIVASLTMLTLLVLGVAGCEPVEPPEPEPTGPFGLNQNTWAILKVAVIPFFVALSTKVIELGLKHLFGVDAGSKRREWTRRGWSASKHAAKRGADTCVVVYRSMKDAAKRE